MSITHTQTLSVANVNVGLSGSFTETGGTEVVVDQSIPASTANQAYALSVTAANLQSLIILADTNMTLKVNGVNAVQSLAQATGTSTAGTFTSSFGGQTATGLAWNISASAYQAAMQALSSIGAGNLACTGGPLPGTPIVVTFAGSLGLAPQSTITVNSAGLTGGTVGVTSTTSGVAPDKTYNLVANRPLVWAESGGYFANPLPATTSNFFFSTTTGAARFQARILST